MLKYETKGLTILPEVNAFGLWSATSPQFFTAVAGWAASAIRGVPFVFELGDLWPASIAAVGAMKRSLALKLVEKLELFLYISYYISYILL